MYDRADFAFASALASAWNAHCRTSGFVMTTYFNLTDVHKWDFGCNQEVCMWPANIMNNAQFGKAQTFLPGIGGFRSRSCWAMCNIPHYISSRKLKWWCVLHFLFCQAWRPKSVCLAASTIWYCSLEKKKWERSLTSLAERFVCWWRG